MNSSTTLNDDEKWYQFGIAFALVQHSYDESTQYNII